MMFNVKKTTLAMSVAVSLSLLTGCGGSSSDGSSASQNNTNNSTVNQQSSQSVKAFASNAKFVPVEVASWQSLPVLPSEPDHFDESVIDMSVQNGQLVALTRWHNSIIKVNQNQAGQANVNPEYFATLVTAEHGKASDADDIVSGASEHLLSDVKYGADNHHLYALVRAPKKAVAGDDTFGLFKIGLNADGSLPKQTINGKAATHRGNHVQRAEGNFNLMLPLNDGAVLVSDVSNKAVRYYDANFALQEAKSFALKDKTTLQSWAKNQEALYVLLQAEGETKQQVIEKRLINDLVKVVKQVPAVDVNKIQALGNQVLLIGKNKLQLDNANLDSLQQVVFGEEIKRFSVSKDNKRIAVQDLANNLWLVDVAQGKLSNPMKVTIDGVKNIGTFTLDNANTLFFNSKMGKISKLDLNQPIITLNDSQIVQSSLEALKGERFNHGYPLSAVRYDLELPKKDDNLPISYTWSSSNPNVVSNEGKVVVPNGGQPVNVTLTATAKLANGNATASRQFDLQVLPTSRQITSGVDTDLSSVIEKNRFNYNYGQYSSNTANADGSLYALFTTKGLNIIQKQADNQVKAALKENQQVINISGTGLAEPQIKTVLWKGNDTLWVLLGNDKAGVLVKKTFTQPQDINALVKQANENWQVVKQFNKPVVAGFINQAKTHVTVVSKNGDDNYQVTTYDVANNAKNIADYTTDANFSINHTAVDDTGRYVFVTTRDKTTGGGVFSRYVDGKKDSEFEVDEPYHAPLVSSEGDFMAGGRYGNVLLIKGATSSAKLNKANAKKFSFARSDYNGSTYATKIDHHNGRIYSTALVNHKLFVGYYGIGVSVVDVSDVNRPVEVQFIPYQKQYLVLPSTDGRYLLQAGDRNGLFKLTPLQ